MRESRPSGSEGGVPRQRGIPTPIETVQSSIVIRLRTFGGPPSVAAAVPELRMTEPCCSRDSRLILFSSLPASLTADFFARREDLDHATPRSRPS